MFKTIKISSINYSNLNERQINLIVIAILSLYPLIGMGIDLIAPSLPALTTSLNISSKFSKNLITIYFIGYMLGNFIVGFLSDALGRRKLVVWGLFFFMLASFMPVVDPQPAILLLSRLFQGFTIAAFAVSSRAILSDLLSKEKLIRTATFMATMWGIGPIIGPIIGGYLQYYFNWQASFCFFSVLGFLGFLIMYCFVPETNFSRQELKYQQLKNNFLTIVSNQVFLGIVTLMGITYSLLIVFNTLAPFYIQKNLGYSSIYFGHIAFVMGTIFFLGTFICRQLLKHFTPEYIIFYTIHFLIIVSLIFIPLAYIQENNSMILIIPSFFMFLGCGIIYPAAMGKALSLFQHLAGSGAATMNLINTAITSFISYIMSLLYSHNLLLIIFIYLFLMVCGSIIYNYSLSFKAEATTHK